VDVIGFWNAAGLEAAGDECCFWRCKMRIVGQVGELWENEGQHQRAPVEGNRMDMECKERKNGEQ
jgi:hypothetical protein